MESIRVEQNDNISTLHLAGTVSLEEAEELRATLVNIFNASEDIEIDTSAIEETDISLPQLLCAAHKASVKKRKSLTIKGGLNEPVMSVVRKAGLIPHHGCGDEYGRTCLFLK